MARQIPLLGILQSWQNYFLMKCNLSGKASKEIWLVGTVASGYSDEASQKLQHAPQNLYLKRGKGVGVLQYG